MRDRFALLPGDGARRSGGLGRHPDARGRVSAGRVQLRTDARADQSRVRTDPVDLVASGNSVAGSLPAQSALGPADDRRRTWGGVGGRAVGDWQ